MKRKLFYLHEISLKIVEQFFELRCRDNSVCYDVHRFLRYTFMCNELTRNVNVSIVTHLTLTDPMGSLYTLIWLTLDDFTRQCGTSWPRG